MVPITLLSLIGPGIHFIAPYSTGAGLSSFSSDQMLVLNPTPVLTVGPPVAGAASFLYDKLPLSIGRYAR
jgi:hypothetical protein